MQIKGSNPAFVVNIRRPEQAAPVSQTKETRDVGATQAPAKAAGSSDRVVLSARSREIDRLKQAMDQLPEVRPEKVALAKQKLQDGSYNGNAGAVAQSLVDSLKRG